MTYQDSVIFQCTDSGNAEIHRGKMVLLHNERLMLVLIDGVRTYVELRAKKHSLTRDNFDRALDGLKQKGLVVEILFPLIDRQKDVIAPDILVDFLKVNSGRLRHADAPRGDVAYSGMISDNGYAGLSVDTKVGVTSVLGRSALSSGRQLDGDEKDADLPMDVSLDGVAVSSRAKTKLANVFPAPEKRRRKKSRRPVPVRIGWHIYVYYGLLAIGVGLVGYSVFIHSFM